jgi:adenylosuccinate synthase
MKRGHSDVIVGLDYGDEGKGRFTDIMLESGSYKIVVRFNGGNNAGHTIFTKDGKKIILNSIPSGILYPEITNYIASGCVVDPVHLVEKEIPQVREYIKSPDQLKISALATAITPIHILWDRITGALVGTTGNGIGPAYADKARRSEGETLRNLRLADILQNPAKSQQTLLKQYAELIDVLKLPQYLNIVMAFCRKAQICVENVSQKQMVEAIAGKFQIESQITAFIEATIKLQKDGFIEKNDLWLTDQVENGKNVLMEGAQAYGLDVTYGQTPYTTSSATFAGNAYVGGDLSPKYHDRIIGITKAITSRVGSGPFVGEFGGRESEIHCDAKDENGGPLHGRESERKAYNVEEMLASENPFEFGIGLRMATDEYGARTGRPRRIGMIDVKRIANAVRKTGVDDLFITKVDCLKHYAPSPGHEIPVITGYKHNGQSLDYIPPTAEELYQVKPEIIHTPGFGDISKIRQANDLPSEVHQFVGLMQQATRCRIAGIGVGPGREEMVYFK